MPFLCDLARILWRSDRTAELYVYSNYLRYRIPILTPTERSDVGALIKVIRKEHEIEVHFERAIPSWELGERRNEPVELK